MQVDVPQPPETAAPPLWMALFMGPPPGFWPMIGRWLPFIMFIIGLLAGAHGAAMTGVCS